MEIQYTSVVREYLHIIILHFPLAVSPLVAYTGYNVARHSPT